MRTHRPHLPTFSGGLGYVRVEACAHERFHERLIVGVTVGGWGLGVGGGCVAEVVEDVRELLLHAHQLLQDRFGQVVLPQELPLGSAPHAPLVLVQNVGEQDVVTVGALGQRQAALIHLAFLAHGNEEGVAVTKAGGDREDGIEAGEERAEEDHLPTQAVDREARQVTAQRSESFLLPSRDGVDLPEKS